MSSAEQLEFAFDWRDLKLAGSLHLPAGIGPHPAVVMAQGSGPADRDSGGYFEPIRETFISKGIATFAFDKPGCGDSSGDWRHYGLEDRADQLSSGIGCFRNHPRIEGEHVGIWGHSQGGWLVQKLAGRRTDLAFAIASSAPTLNVAAQILYDSEQALRTKGADDDQVQGALSLVRAIHEAAAADANFESVSRQLLEPQRNQPWYESFPTIADADDWQHVKVLVGEPHDPISDLFGVMCPFLAVYGARDDLLPPWQSAEDTGRSLGRADCADATVVVFPRGDHRMQAPESDDFVDGYLDLLGGWAAPRAF